MLDERADEELRRLALAAALGLCQVTVLFGAATSTFIPGIAQRGRALAEALGDAEAMARLCYIEGIATMASEGGLQRGIALAEEGVAIAERAGLKPVAMGLSRGLGVTYVLDGRFAVAEEVTGQVVRSLEEAGHKERLSDLYVSSRWVRDSVLHLSDEIDEAARASRETYDMAVRAQNRTVRSASASTLAQVHFVRAEYDQAKRWADEAFEIAEAIGNVPAFPAAAAIALASRVELGEKPSPDHYLDAIEQGLGTAGSLQLNIRFVGEALSGLDVPDRAARLADQLRRGPTGGRLRQTLVMIAAADLMLRAGRVQEAAEGYAHAIAKAEEIGARAALVAATLGAATIASERGEPVMAAALARAIDIARALRLERYRPRLERLLGTASEAVSA
jgi:tetratricopeptide (TPR) repeat protein